MKKLITLISFLCLSIVANSQFPVTQNLGSSNTLVRVPPNGALKANLINGTYVDTTAANLTNVDYYPGAQIYTTSDSSVWVRNSTATRWIGQAGGSIINIYDNSITSISIVNDSCISMCTGAGACSTVCSNVIIQSTQVLNDSTIIVCGFVLPDTVTYVCDTLHFPPVQFFVYQNGLTQIGPGIVEWGGNLSHSTVIDQLGYDLVFNQRNTGVFMIYNLGTFKSAELVLANPAGGMTYRSDGSIQSSGPEITLKGFGITPIVNLASKFYGGIEINPQGDSNTYFLVKGAQKDILWTDPDNDAFYLNPGVVSGTSDSALVRDPITDRVSMKKISGGGATYTFPYSVTAPGNAIQLKNDTSASAPVSVFYGTNPDGRFGFYNQSLMYKRFGVTGEDNMATANRLFDLSTYKLNIKNGNTIFGKDTGSIAMVQIGPQPPMKPYLHLGVKSTTFNGAYVVFDLWDTLTVANAATAMFRGFQMRRVTWLNESGIVVEDKEGSNIAHVFALGSDSVTMQPQGGDLIYGNRSGLNFQKSSSYGGRSAVKIGGLTDIDAASAQLSAISIQGGGVGANIVIKGDLAAHSSYLYAQSADDSIDRYFAYLSYGASHIKVKKMYHYYATPIGDGIDTSWGFYTVGENYNYMGGRLGLGGLNDRPDSTLQIDGGFWAKRGARFSGLPTGKQAKQLFVDATGTLFIGDSTGTGGGGGGGGSPAGNNRNIQWNDAGSFGGNDSLQFAQSEVLVYGNGTATKPAFASPDDPNTGFGNVLGLSGYSVFVSDGSAAVAFTPTGTMIGSASQHLFNANATAYGGGDQAGIAYSGTDKLKITDGSTGRGDLEVLDDAYNATTWDGNFTVPTKNAIRDKIESLSGATTWNAITDPTGTQTLSFGDAELTSWTNGSNTETFQTITSNSLTTGTVLKLTTSSMTSGNLIDLSSTSTAILTNASLINLTSSGAIASGQTAAGIIVNMANTGSGAENLGGYFYSSGASTNIGIWAEANGSGGSNVAGHFKVGEDGGYPITTEGGNVGIETSTPTSRLQVAGSVGFELLSTASSTTAGDRFTIVVTATGQTITLPDASGIQGRIYVVKLTASGSATVATTGGDLIDASTTYSLSAQYKFVMVQSDGTNYVIIGQN